MGTPLPGGVRLGLVTTPQGLGRIEFLPPDVPLQPPRDPVADRFAAQLQEYFHGKLTRFEGPLAPANTPFRRRVRALLEAIPPGAVRTYGQLAGEIRTAPRALAGACRTNPLPLIIPCHRVVAAGGPGGYMGQAAGRALEYKQWLLRHEGAE